MGKLRSIQVLRAIAVVAVVYCHAFATQRGSSGVDLFFVISGFIIARVSQDRPPLAFAKARFWRIWPLYVLAASPYIAWQLANAADAAPKIAATLSLWPIWAGQYQEPLLPVAWSLYFEVLFYAAIIVWLVSRRAAAMMATTIILVAVARPGPITAYLLSPIIVEFAAGYGLARLRTFRLASPMLILGLAILFAPARGFEGGTMLDAGQAGLRLAMFGIPSVMIVYGALGLEQGFAARWADPLVRIGDASYSIYLTHLMPVHGLPAWPSAVKFLVSLLLGLVVHSFVERPLGDWVARRNRRHPSERRRLSTARPLPNQG